MAEGGEKYPFFSFNEKLTGQRYRGEKASSGKLAAPRLYTSSADPSSTMDERDSAGLGIVFTTADLAYNDTDALMFVCADPSDSAAEWVLIGPGVGSYRVDETDITQGAIPWFDTPSASFKYSARWEDFRFPLVGRNLDISSGRIDYNFGECTVDFANNARFDTNEAICMIVQFPHGKKIGSSVRPHLHWIQNDSDIPNWIMEYRWYNNGATVPSFAAQKYTPTAAAIFSDTVYPLAQYTKFPEISAPAGEDLSSFMDIILYRDTENTSTLFTSTDPVAGVAAGKEFDLHIEMLTSGSTTEFVQ